MKTIHYLSVLAIAAVFASCSKGDTGPAGPAGPTGPAGSANVITTTYTVTPGQWNTLTAGFNYDVILNASALSNSNADNVEVSANGNNSSNWGLIPANNFIVNGDELAVIYTNGQVEVVYNYTSSPTVTVYFKVTVIPAAIRRQHPNLTKQQIIQLYGQEQPANTPIQ